MALFYGDSIVLVCADVQAEKQWWIPTFQCKETKVPADWDCPLPSDVALKLPGDDEPTILFNAKSEVLGAGYARENNHPMVFAGNLKKAHEHLQGRGVAPSAIQDGGGGPQYFEVRDPQGNVIEICEEP